MAGEEEEGGPGEEERGPSSGAASAREAEQAGEAAAPLSALLQKDRITLFKTSKNLTVHDIEHARPSPFYEVRKTTIKPKYVVEEIPIPSVNNIRTLTSSSKFFNKPKPYLDEATGDTVYIASVDNYISSGSTSNISIGGDIGTHYTIVIKDITNTKWYNWDTEKFENGYSEKCGDCGDEKLYLDIPPEILETTYNIFFKTSGSEIYDANLPTETNPWVINQLAEVTTTFKFDSGNGYNSDQTSTKTHAPGVILNAGSTNSGKIPITITTFATRGTIELNTERLNNKVNVGDVLQTGNEDDPVIIDTDLIASVDAATSTGTITGTITLGKSSIRDTNVLFNPEQFFKIT